MDSELALMIQEGHASDPRVIDAIVQQYAPNVYHLGLGLLNGHPDAQTNARKITTGAFIAALNDPESFRGREDIRSWLYGVAVRIARGNRPRRGPRASTPPGWDADSRVDALPEGDRLPIILRYGHRLTLPQIAQILHIPEHKVHKRLARARRKLLAGERPGAGKVHKSRQIQAALDGLGELANEQEHLTACPDCQAYLQQHTDLETRLIDCLQSRPNAALSEQDIREIAEAVANREEKTGRWNGPLHRTSAAFVLKEIVWIGVAAVVFLIAARLLNPFFSDPPPPSTPIPTTAPAALPEQVPPFAPPYEAAAQPPAEHLIWQWVRTLRGTILRETISLAPESFAVSPDGRYAAYTNLDHTALVLRDLANPEVQEEVLTASVPLSSLLAFSADAGWLASVEPSGNVLVWDVGARSLSFRLQHPKPVRALAFSPASSRRLAVGAGDGVWLWERGDGTFVGIDDPLGELPVEALAFSPDGERLAAADSEHAITIWQVSNGEALLRFPAHDATITRLAFSPNGRRLASASRDKTVKIFAFSETSGGTLRGTLVHTLQHIDTVVGAAFSPEGRALGTTMGWGQPQLWNPDTGLASEIPAGLPFDSETASIAFVQMDGAPHLITVSTEGTLDWYTLADVSDRVTAVPEPFFFTRAEGDFIQRKVNIQTSPPGQSLEKAYSLTLEDAAALAGFEVKIPDFGFSNRYEPIGAAYDAVAQTVAFAYHYNAPAGDTPVQVYLIQWPQSAPQPDIGGSWSVLPSKQLIGASAIVQRVQIGRGVGEFVAGSWIPLAQDNPELLAFPWDEILEGEYTLWHRWNPAYFHRLRWQQGDTMLEIQTGFVNPPGKAHVFGVEEMQQIAMDIAKQDEAPTLLAYTIQDGDTCISIAFKYGITTRAIMHTNGLDNCDLIIAGQTLLIPLPQARNFIISTDLNCDGASEGIQIIPAPQAYGDSFTNFGAVMKTYLRTSADTAVFWPVWQLTIADIPVEFFGVPEVFSMGGCEELLAITAFGGDPAFAGLDVYRWDGEQMTLVLDANGFVEGPIRDLPQAGGAPFTISTQNLAYDETTAVCTRTTTTYEWDRETFVEAGVDVKEGADCFASAP